MDRRYIKLERGRDWTLFQVWSNVETHMLRGYDKVAEAPGRSMSPTEAAKLIVQMKRDGWREKRG
jgi:hypothetical protein